MVMVVEEDDHVDPDGILAISRASSPCGWCLLCLSGSGVFPIHSGGSSTTWLNQSVLAFQPTHCGLDIVNCVYSCKTDKRLPRTAQISMNLTLELG